MPGEKSLLPGSWPEGSGYAVHTCKFIYIPGRNDLLKTFGARLMTIEGGLKNLLLNAV